MTICMFNNVNLLRQYMIDTIIFDFDGVILNSEPMHFEALVQVLNQSGINLAYEEYMTHYLGLSDISVFPKILNDKGLAFSSTEIRQLIERKVTVYNELIEDSEQLPMTLDLDWFLVRVAKQYGKIGICSGSNRHSIIKILEKIHCGRLACYFKTIVSCEDVSLGKPSPEGYLLAAHRLQSNPENCLVIEDSEHGVAAAKAGGMLVAGLLTTLSRDQLANADMIVHDFKELAHLLDSQ
ncbi:TPA: HAD-IA family hydrolase [Legionella pneumophila subsp. pneumophila]|nr:HAD-IA family hydrolase [Legionella pneumophila]HAT8842097.1 HAD-IA family hydrolase [Legionella pneumophila subsp. pneumophila]HAT9216356.1 HAD-IA family hydrolase [Legionella pneumophila subsp. pneumophila]HAT9230386.1 HAD-IA family hydrolase [Legionella pneumophila subsp. pneumophila]HAT9262461.1 HAD-IA family hydrolase [Legionella pneumophila subsp. pneumophila]